MNKDNYISCLIFVLVFFGLWVYAEHKEVKRIELEYQQYKADIYDRMQGNKAGLDILNKYEYEKCKEWEENTTTRVLHDHCSQYLKGLE